MPSKYEPEPTERARQQQQVQQPVPAGEASATSQETLATLTQVFKTFQRQLQNQPPRPFADEARVAVDVFNDIGARLQLKFLPDQPKLEIQTLSQSEIKLKWKEETNNADGFKIWRCQGPCCVNFDEIKQIGVNVKEYLDNNLSSGTTYRYKLSAFNFRGETFSNIVDVTTK